MQTWWEGVQAITVVSAGAVGDLLLQAASTMRRPMNVARTGYPELSLTC